MAFHINPYFTFTGDAREALTFYQSVFGGELHIATFNDFHAPVAPEHTDLVMHGELTAESFSLQASDGAVIHEPENNATTNMEAAIIGSSDDVAQATEWFNKLSEGATKLQPLTEAPWGAHFGSFTDKFGIAWLFNIGG